MSGVVKVEWQHTADETGRGASGCTPCGWCGGGPTRRARVTRREYAASAREQRRRVADGFRSRFPRLATLLDETKVGLTQMGG